MITRRYRAALLSAALFSLAACGSDDRADDQRTAVGKILPGSASDAMIHYDKLRSQPPLAPQTGSGGSARADTDAAAEEAADEEAEGEAAAADDGEPTAAPAAE